MKKSHTFSRYIFLVLLVLESLTLVVVVGVLYAMLVNAIDREYHNQISAHKAEFRLFLKERFDHANKRLDELSTNNGIKVALLLGMSHKTEELVTAHYPPANGVTYYIRTMSGDVLPPPSGEHTFLRTLNSAPGDSSGTWNPDNRTTPRVFARSIVRKGTVVGQAVGVYDLAADQELFKLQTKFMNNRLLWDAPEGLTSLNDGQLIELNAPQKKRLQRDGIPIQVSEMLISPIKDYRQVYLASDTRPLSQQKQKLLLDIVLLCIPLLGLTLAASFMILKKVTSPLNTLAEDARQITQDDSAHYLDEAKIKHIEFLDLTRAFNNALTHIRQRREQLLQLNQSLQDEIFERKQLGDALAKSEQKLRSLQDNIPIGLFRTTPTGKVLHANPACMTIFGYDSLAQFKAFHDNVLFLYADPKDREKVLEHLKETGAVDGWRMRMRRKDGSVFWALMHSKKIIDANDGSICLDGTIQDINQQVEAEHQKRQLETQLQQSQKMETIGTLAGGIAHDFNNLLASIIGFSELAVEDSQPGSIQEENLNSVLIAAQRAADLVSQILTFARQTDTEKKPVRVKDVLSEAVRLLRSTLPSTIKIEEKIESRASVLAAPTQLHQVIVNLCSNAGHAMRDSGGWLRVELTDVELDPTRISPDGQVKAGPNVKLTINDTGHGIAPEFIDRIFDPYFTTKKPGEGTGIGLSVVQGIVRSYGGFITVESQPGKGTTFQVFLPVIVADDVPKTISSAHVVGGDERILLVDDEALVIQMGHRMLERLGYRVTSHSSSLEAYRLFEQRPDQFDLVITDMTMPDMTGDCLAKRISEIRPEIPIILCTGYSNRLDHQNVTDAGVRAILYKPLVRTELAGAIREALDSESLAQAV